VFAGVTLDHWERIFAPHITEFSATRWAFSNEVDQQIRIAFGNKGPFTSAKGDRDKPLYSHAVTLPRAIAVDFARTLLQQLAEVKQYDD
jgi:hypothetical protein